MSNIRSQRNCRVHSVHDDRVRPQEKRPGQRACVYQRLRDHVARTARWTIARSLLWQQHLRLGQRHYGLYARAFSRLLDWGLVIVV